ncbi:MAG: thioredoxin family protein [Lachnospiraceae bacterium]|jgi:hypothetical protein|nr:thioredoxin family protein [Lachnospiraceae bacterium]
MAFRIGANSNGKDEGIVRGAQKEIGCQCWFTSTGRIMPLMIKLEDENGEIMVIREITVHSQEIKRYAGSPSVELECTLWLRENKMSARLIYYVTQSKWVLNFK